VTNADLTPIGIGDVLGTGWLLLFFDGVEWSIVAGTQARVPGALPILQKVTNWYVNASTGDDTLRDGTSATLGPGKIGPFKTISRAAVEVRKYNMNGYDQYIYVADGVYNETVPCQTTNGAGIVHFVGNPNAPQNVQLTSPNTQLACCFYQSGNSSYTYNGFRLSTPPAALDCIANNGGQMQINNMRFGPAARYHISCGDSGASTSLWGPSTVTIEAGANASEHMNAQLVGFLSFPVPLSQFWPSLTILGPVNFGAFCGGDSLGLLQMRYTSITGAAYVTGAKYSASMNGCVSSVGAGPNYFPGNVAGSVGTGGQYQ
jgi:hypothetical protein